MISFKPTEPAQFQVGDIVEVQMTVIAVPIKEGHFKMIHQLRSLALIDSSFSQVCIFHMHCQNTHLAIILYRKHLEIDSRQAYDLPFSMSL